MSARSIAWSPGAAGPLLEPETPWDWTLLADCQYTDPEAFFPEKGASVREAKRVCAGCLVRNECLEYALETGQRFGIWGGTTERQRRAMKPCKPAVQPAPLLCISGRHPKSGPGRCLDCKKDRDLERAKTRARATAKDLAA
jgi:WhiB family redox-sensing transcriptional regulator